MLIEWAALVLVAAMALLISAGVGSTAELRTVRNLLVAGAAMRIVGVFARHWMIFGLYDGVSDAVGYYESGLTIAQHFHAFDFSIVGSGRWGEREWGTQAVRYAAGVVMTFAGPSVRGTFLVFSMMAFAGLVCMVVACGRASSSGSMKQAALLLFFWPTLWFWPSSIGKEAVLLLAVGLVTLGYVGRAGRISWLPMLAGLALALSIRPHVAGVLAVAMCAAEWSVGGWTLRRVTQSMLTSALAMWLVVRAFGLLGLDTTDYSSVESFVQQWAQQTSQGGSAFARADSPAMAVPMAFLNLLFRPFVTEARSSVALLSSLEMVMFWVLMVFHRPRVASGLRSWQTNRLLRFAILFSVLYILMIGLTFQNMGLIARQRTLVMPALLVVVAGTMPTVSRRVNRARKTWASASAVAAPVSG